MTEEICAQFGPGVLAGKAVASLGQPGSVLPFLVNSAGIFELSMGAEIRGGVYSTPYSTVQSETPDRQHMRV